MVARIWRISVASLYLRFWRDVHTTGWMSGLHKLVSYRSRKSLQIWRLWYIIQRPTHFCTSLAIRILWTTVKSVFSLLHSGTIPIMGTEIPGAYPEVIYKHIRRSRSSKLESLIRGVVNIFNWVDFYAVDFKPSTRSAIRFQMSSHLYSGQLASSPTSVRNFKRTLYIFDAL